MNITIKRSISKETIKLYKTVTFMRMAPIRKMLIILFLFGTALSLASVENGNWGWFTCIGISIVIYVIVHAFIAYFGTDSYLKYAEAFIDRAPKDNNIINIVITDDCFTYETFESKIILQWSAFSSYRIYHEDIFLMVGGNYSNSYFIKKNEFGKEDFSTLVQFISSILPQKGSKHRL